MSSAHPPRRVRRSFITDLQFQGEPGDICRPRRSAITADLCRARRPGDPCAQGDPRPLRPSRSLRELGPPRPRSGSGPPLPHFPQPNSSSSCTPPSSISRAPNRAPTSCATQTCARTPRKASPLAHSSPYPLFAAHGKTASRAIFDLNAFPCLNFQRVRPPGPSIQARHIQGFLFMVRGHR